MRTKLFALGVVFGFLTPALIARADLSRVSDAPMVEDDGPAMVMDTEQGTLMRGTDSSGSVVADDEASPADEAAGVFDEADGGDVALGDDAGMVDHHGAVRVPSDLGSDIGTGEAISPDESEPVIPSR